MGNWPISLSNRYQQKEDGERKERRRIGKRRKKVRKEEEEERDKESNGRRGPMLMRQTVLLSAENRLLRSKIQKCRKSIYPPGYMPENSRPQRPIGSFSTLQHRLKPLPAA
jgi:hypothetical protein